MIYTVYTAEFLLFFWDPSLKLLYCWCPWALIRVAGGSTTGAGADAAGGFATGAAFAGAGAGGAAFGGGVDDVAGTAWQGANPENQNKNQTKRINKFRFLYNLESTMNNENQHNLQ